ncbi:MAG TPA: helix-turn-helix transcriptional regulator [Ramlibacter sp.]|nr:helix-turn-helix transcriptional regulator [Ramlibacter sp.]
MRSPIAAPRDAMPAPPERIVFTTRRVTVGEWRCGPAHPLFEDSGPIERHLAAFPRTAVLIRHAGGRAFVADAAIATLYNKGQRYTRDVVHPEGDRCDWWATDPETAAEISAAVDARVGPGDERPLRHMRAPVDAALYLRQRSLLLRLKARDVEPLAAEEEALGLLHDTFAAAARAEGAAPPRISPRSRELAQAAACELAASWHQRITLDDLSGRLGASPFHICRSFHAVTGRPLHRHLTALRLRASLESVAERRSDLTHVALEHGFGSHSHFSAAFRREFGVAPSAWRTRAIF